MFFTKIAIFILFYSFTEQKSVKQEWRTYLKKYKIKIMPGEENMRYKIFKTSLENVKNQKKMNLGYTIKINRFSHLKPHELPVMGPEAIKKHLILTKPDQKTMKIPKITTVIPESVDWRKHNVVTPVVNQGGCGSCWAFSCAGVIESQFALGSGYLTHLSTQQIIDCNPYNYGCSGGNPYWTLVALAKTGVEPWSFYPYKFISTPCKYEAIRVYAYIEKPIALQSGNEQALTDGIATYGPISITINASAPGFGAYATKVFYAPDCGKYTDHAVIAVGYGITPDGVKYYIVKNSWGSWWGDNGYILMSRDRNNNCQIAGNSVAVKYRSV